MSMVVLPSHRGAPSGPPCYTQRFMRLDVPRIQASIRAAGLDGWLLFDFHGANPIASRMARLNDSGTMTTRRWYYLIPATGDPVGLVHAIESHNLDALPGEKRVYAGHRTLNDELRRLLTGHRRVAMEYSPRCAIPYLSRVDAGTIEQIRDLGIEVVSSGDLVQRFEAIWDDAALASHRTASERLYRIKDRAFAAVAKRLAENRPTTEFDIQAMMVDWFGEEGLVSDSAPVVAAAANSADPHYLPTATRSRSIDPGDVLLFDLWGRLDEAGTVFADITWVGVVDRQVPRAIAGIFDIVAEARDTAVTTVESAVRSGEPLGGWQVDRAARDVIEKAGYGSQFVHRTGHSLGEEVHGNGVHMDDYETHDDRQLVPGTGFTIEPGIYLDDWGIRTEINMHFGEREAAVTGPVQTEVIALLA